MSGLASKLNNISGYALKTVKWENASPGLQAWDWVLLREVIAATKLSAESILTSWTPLSHFVFMKRHVAMVIYENLMVLSSMVSRPAAVAYVRADFANDVLRAHRQGVQRFIVYRRHATQKIEHYELVWNLVADEACSTTNLVTYGYNSVGNSVPKPTK